MINKFVGAGFLCFFSNKSTLRMSIHKIVSLSSMALQCNRTGPFLCRNFPYHNLSRFASTNRIKHMALKKEKEKFRTYVIQRYIDYVKNYTKFLEERFPTAMNMYRVFSVGIKDLLKDLKTYISLRIKIVKDQGFSNLSRREIELYQKMPSDMLKIAPVLILSAIPFGNYVIFPLAFWKPKTLLCSHFWSIQQKAEFSTQDLTERLKNNKPVFRALQSKLDFIKEHELKMKFRSIVALLGSGVHPSPTEILSCIDLFKNGPYCLQSLSYTHMGYLLTMHGQRKTLFRSNKLKYRAFLLLEMDRAIKREGGVEQLTTEALRNACYIRGLNDKHLTNKDMKDWLTKWLTVSEHVDKMTYSLILHCPIFFAYNHPQNWVLIY